MNKRTTKEKKKREKLHDNTSMYIVIAKKMNIIFINFLGWTTIITVDRRIFVEIVVPTVWNSVFSMIIYFLIRLFQILRRICVIAAVISVIREWPELCGSSRSFHDSKYLFPINVPCDRHLLSIHVYLYRIHSYTYSLYLH